ncbi:histidinol-phosphatase HisJ family protein [Candidatus Methylacidithermus pantelleriae]|uniref:Histidinol-phosphatase n=1 Tax=Candidatus Methylacidithermus pantelleriae TaxID=2744239 RepID=A0A8J2FTC7_9BACT|nr:histidinol-phosphatase HisJ family protein [Candidatus Methylacidithermus pantelleriae]CAF0702454.1 Histidinol-phosphatase [Candidatus Methylacidithermus pantelleriae]
MNVFLDYHMHPQGHRLQPYTLANLARWSEACRKKGIRDFAITDHDRYHPGVRFDVVEQWREANPDLTIRCGIELDNDPETGAEGRAWVQRNWGKLDFVLGSVHFLEDWPFDHPDHREEFKRRDIHKVYEAYCRELLNLIRSYPIDCLAHLDLIKIFGYRPEGDILHYFDPVLQAIRDSGLALEISTAGWRKPVGEVYPSERILERARELGIPFTIASDAHSEHQVGENYDRLADLLTRLNIRTVVAFDRHRPIPICLD